MADTPPPPSTTIIPFGTLPACAASCGVLYDANGGCVPPASGNDVDNNCFCSFAALQPFQQGSVNGVCDSAGCAPTDLTSIQSWYTSYCADAGIGGTEQTITSGESSATSTPTAGSSAGNSSNDGSGGGDWISNHWRWVIAIVILIVGIAGIWIGACIWRRRYLKRKATKFGKHTSTTAFPAPGGSTVHVPGPGGTEAQNGPGMFMPGAAAPSPYDEKPKKEKKKWIVNQRT
ncbi:hypothetical protein ACHAQA_002302 [Verticillium albo-atrum]